MWILRWENEVRRGKTIYKRINLEDFQALYDVLADSDIILAKNTKDKVMLKKQPENAGMIGHSRVRRLAACIPI